MEGGEVSVVGKGVRKEKGGGKKRDERFFDP